MWCSFQVDLFILIIGGGRGDLTTLPLLTFTPNPTMSKRFSVPFPSPHTIWTKSRFGSRKSRLGYLAWNIHDDQRKKSCKMVLIDSLFRWHSITNSPWHAHFQTLHYYVRLQSNLCVVQSNYRKLRKLKQINCRPKCWFSTADFSRILSAD